MAGFVECLDSETAEEIINPVEGMKRIIISITKAAKWLKKGREGHEGFNWKT